jgi:hypothetical protein
MGSWAPRATIVRTLAAYGAIIAAAAAAVATGRLPMSAKTVFGLVRFRRR